MIAFVIFVFTALGFVFFLIFAIKESNWDGIGMAFALCVNGFLAGLFFYCVGAHLESQAEIVRLLSVLTGDDADAASQ